MAPCGPPDRLRAPPAAWDCHVHVYGPVEHFPATEDGRFRPPERRYPIPRAPLSDYLCTSAEACLERAVLVQPNVYGTDHRYLCHALERTGGRFKAVAVIDDRTTGAELRNLASLGVAGARLHWSGGRDFERLLARLARRIAPLGWHLDLYLQGADLQALAPLLRRLPTPVVLDHYAGLNLRSAQTAREIETLLSLLESGACFVKLSAPYRITGTLDHAELTELHERLLTAAPERLLWGSDWPHPRAGLVVPPIKHLLSQVLDTLGSDAARRAVLVENPSRLYGA